MSKPGASATSALLLALVALSSVVLLISCSSPFGSAGEYGYGSNGERIYFTARSSSGEPITYSGGIRMMHSITCANCHRGTAGAAEFQ